jgi:oligopeptide transport system substrate-binding protein
VSDDGITYRFKLRANAKWSNGDPVTAGDFVFSFRRVEDPKSNSKYADELYPIKNAEAVNTGKLDVTALGVAAPHMADFERSELRQVLQSGL